MVNDLFEVIQQAAIAAYPNEACGVVVRIGKKSVPIECKNVAPTPNLHFMIDPADYSKAADRGEVIGIWHTHVELAPTPSDADRVGCERSGLPWFIASIYKREEGFVVDGPLMIEPDGFQMGYLERPYIFGVFDCYTLVRDYYRQEFQINLGEYPRIERFWAKGYNFFGENWKKEGFVQLIDGEEPQAGDVFLIQTDNTDSPSHVAVYIGDDMILHHAHGRLSRRDIYGGYWQKHTSFHLRHKTRC